MAEQFETVPVPTPEQLAAEPPQQKQHSIMLTRFPYQNAEAPSVGNYMVDAVVQCKAHPAIGQILHREYDDTPITMTRNLAVRQAMELGVDFLLMLDSDMHPDLPYPDMRPFLPTALDFLLKQETPSVVAAPYCGPPPHCNVYVFRWGRLTNDLPDPDWSINQFSREEAAVYKGFMPCAALATGLMLIDMRVFERLAPPYFYYEYSDGSNSEKASTEDVTFTRDLGLNGVPLYVLWDSWAGHHKRYLVPKPRPVFAEEIGEKYKKAFQDGVKRTHQKRFVIFNDGKATDLEGNPTKLFDVPAEQPPVNAERLKREAAFARAGLMTPFNDKK